MPKPKLQAPADWFFALGEPSRLALVVALAGGGRHVGALCEACGMPFAKVSHHLSVLKDFGVVTQERNSKFQVYALVGASVKKGVLELTHPSGVTVVIPLA